MCLYLREGSLFEFNNKEFMVNLDMMCFIKNLIYVIICVGCGKYYIGEIGIIL